MECLTVWHWITFAVVVALVFIGGWWRAAMWCDNELRLREKAWAEMGYRPPGGGVRTL